MMRFILIVVLCTGLVKAYYRRCGRNEEWSTLGDHRHCPSSNPPTLPWEPTAACACKADYRRHVRTGECVRFDECPMQCPDGRFLERDEAVLHCVPTCDLDSYFPEWSCRYCENCQPGYYRYQNSCIRRNECPKDCERQNCPHGYVKRKHACISARDCVRPSRPPLPAFIGRNPTNKVWTDEY